MIEKHNFQFADFRKEAPKELTLLSIIAQSFYQPISLDDNLLVILTALTSGSGVGFNRAMLFVREGDSLKGRVWLGPRSPEQAGFIWEILSTPGIGYIEIIEYNRSLVSQNKDTLSQKIKDLSYSPEGESCLLPARAACLKEIVHVRNAANEDLVDKNFLDIIQAEEFLCVPLLAKDEVMGEIVLDNAFTRAPITERDIKLAGLCGLIGGNYIYSTFLHSRLLEMEKTAALGEIAMFVTHQLRNPLVTIGGFTDQLLQADTGREKVRRNLHIIRNEVRRLEDIVFQMGHFLKVSTKEPVYLDTLPAVEAVLKSPEILAKGEDYDLIVDLGDVPPRIFCDPTSFGEVFRNLLDNAFDATSPGGLIQVRGHRKNSQSFVLSVRDTGRGISKPDKERLFKPFFSTKENGIGLGLPFIKRVMDSCGGTIDVQSRLGKGSVFKLTFKSLDKGDSS